MPLSRSASLFSSTLWDSLPSVAMVRYLKSTFVVDLLACMPWDLIYKGIEQFQHALEICPQSACALYGLASGLLALSQDCIKQGAYSWATSLLEDASKIAKGSTIVAGSMPCVWKLHADVQIIV